ncbi:MAG: hypothetical protein ACR2L8_09620 [Solirubrobacteraceae bacterium]
MTSHLLTGLMSRPPKRPIDELGHPPSVTIRPATDADRTAVAQLAALDSRRAPCGETLLAFVDGALQAALGLDGDIAVADPFRPTDGIVQLLRLRATQQLGDRRSTKAARVRRAAACR